MIRFLYILLVGLMVLSLGNSTIVAKEESSDLKSMLVIINQYNDMSMKEWSVSAREPVTGIETKEQFLLKADRLEESLPSFQWQKEENKDVIVLIGKRQDQDFTETVTFISALMSNTVSYVNYEIKGTDLNSINIGRLQEKKDAVLQSVFGEYTIFFTCIKGEISGNIDEVLTSKIESLLIDFRAVETESVREEHFISITANSSLFEQSFIDERNNLQLAMRIDGLGQKTTFVIGTPIITFEY